MNWAFVESLLRYIHQRQNGLLKHFLRPERSNNKGEKKKKKRKEERRGGKDDEEETEGSNLTQSSLGYKHLFSVKHRIKLYSKNLQASHLKLSLSDFNWLLILPLIMNVLAKLSLGKYCLGVN